MNTKTGKEHILEMDDHIRENIQGIDLIGIEAHHVEDMKIEKTGLSVLETRYKLKWS